MRSEFYIHTVKVMRFAQQTVDAFGDPVTSSSPVSPSGGVYLKCRVETYSEMTQYRDSNQRKNNTTLIYFPTSTILRVQDYIVWGDVHPEGIEENDVIGDVIGINPAVKGRDAHLDHWEVSTENP